MPVIVTVTVSPSGSVIPVMPTSTMSWLTGHNDAIVGAASAASGDRFVTMANRALALLKIAEFAVLVAVTVTVTSSAVVPAGTMIVNDEVAVAPPLTGTDVGERVAVMPATLDVACRL